MYLSMLTILGSRASAALRLLFLGVLAGFLAGVAFLLVAALAERREVVERHREEGGKVGVVGLRDVKAVVGLERRREARPRKEKGGSIVLVSVLVVVESVAGRSDGDQVGTVMSSPSSMDGVGPDRSRENGSR